MPRFFWSSHFAISRAITVEGPFTNDYSLSNKMWSLCFQYVTKMWGFGKELSCVLWLALLLQCRWPFVPSHSAICPINVRILLANVYGLKWVKILRVKTRWKTRALKLPIAQSKIKLNCHCTVENWIELRKLNSIATAQCMQGIHDLCRQRSACIEYFLCFTSWSMIDRLQLRLQFVFVN